MRDDSGSRAWAGVMLVLCACSTIEDVGGGTTVIRMAPWVRAALIAVPVTLAVGGLVLARFKGAPRFLGLSLIAGVLFVSAVLLPGIYMDTVTITPQGIVQRTGFWFAPTVKGFEYRDVRDVQIIRREKDDHDFNAWLVRFKDGRTQEIDPGDLWDFNEREIVARLEGYGMVVRKAR